MSVDAAVRWDDLLRCAHEFALEQIRVIQPAMVICLGRSTTYRAIREVLGQSKVSASANQGLPLGPLKCGTAAIYGVTHTGAWGHRWKARMETEWAFLADVLQASSVTRQGR
jgi:hypothetical protein